MPPLNNAFYVKDPATTPDQLKAALEAKYPAFRAYFRSELITLGAKNKNGVYIQLDQSPVTGVKICLDTDNVVTVLPNMGSGCLGFLLGFLEFAFMDFRLASEVGGFLRAGFGETEHLTCPPCDKIYPHYVDRCPRCGGGLTPYANPDGLTGMLPAAHRSSSVAGDQTPPSDPAPSPVPVSGNDPTPKPVTAIPAGPRRGWDRSSAILFELVPGLLGLYGFGWIYSGNTAAGVALLAGGLVWWCISITAAAFTGALSCFCTVPVNLIVATISSVILSDHTKRDPGFIGAPRAEQTHPR